MPRASPQGTDNQRESGNALQERTEAEGGGEGSGPGGKAMALLEHHLSHSDFPGSFPLIRSWLALPPKGMDIAKLCFWGGMWRGDVWWLSEVGSLH